MITINIIGGLGNQMFQYALGRHLSIMKQTDFQLDISGFETYKLHKYNLDKLNIFEKIAPKSIINSGLVFKCQEKYDHLFKPYYKHKYVNELSLSFDEKIFNVDKNAVLTGYWQSEKYFKDIEDVIRKDFTFKTSLSEQNKKFIEMIRTTNSVAIHIRRGDYVSNPMALKIHGICSLEYYYKAMQFIEEKIDNPHYYVFSDDPEWAAQNLKSLYSLTYITGNNVTTYEDLRLMSNCKNHIIANSSFSWWGAWLQKNDDQIVIAPKPWYDDPTLKDYSTIYPDKWIKISKHE